MIIVAPESKNKEMAEEVLRLGLNHVSFARDLLKNADDRLISEFIRGWDAEELRHPILREILFDEFCESKLFLILDFSLDGKLGSILVVSRAEFYAGGGE